MWTMDEKAAAGMENTAWLESWLQRITEGLQDMLRMTTASVLTGLDGTETFAAFRPVPVSRFLTEQIASGGDTVLSAASRMPEKRTDGELKEYLPSLRQDKVRQKRITPYETARTLQKYSELLLRT